MFTRAIMRMIMITRSLQISLAGRTRIISHWIETERSNFRRKVLSFFTLLVSRSFLLLVEANCCLDRYHQVPCDKWERRGRDKRSSHWREGIRNNPFRGYSGERRARAFSSYAFDFSIDMPVTSFVGDIEWERGRVCACIHTFIHSFIYRAHSIRHCWKRY